jgi:hypothetical protein
LESPKTSHFTASDYNFSDKIKYYNGFTKSKGEKKDGTNNEELLILAANQTDFTEQNILDRNATIRNHFIE